MVIIRIWEGLGNQMFQYAYARVLKERGVDVRIDLGKAYNDTFKKNRKHVPRQNSIQNYRITVPEINVEEYGKYAYLQRETDMQKILFWMGTHYLLKYKFYEEKNILYSAKLAALSGNYYVKGWFQDRKYFEDIRDILLKEFGPRKKIKISAALRSAVESDDSVSIHIRRTDYVKMQNTLSSTYYTRAIQHIKTLYKNPLFLVFSDDLEWVKLNLNMDGNLLFVNEDRSLQDYEELYIMSRCRANIIANSTFSWWAAWLNGNGNKTVVAPRRWFPHQKQLIPEDWIIV